HIHRALRPGGRLLLEMPNRELIEQRLPGHHVIERGDDFIIDKGTFDLASSRIVTERVVIRDGTVRRFPFFVRVFSLHEIRNWLEAAGFGEVDAYDSEGATYELTSPRM